MLHIAQYSREKDGHLGGVPKFSWYLKQVFPGLREVTLADYPELHQHQDEAVRAQLLGEMVARKYRGRKKPLAIVDGFWGCGLPDDWPVIVVAHGTWEHIGWRTNNDAARVAWGKLQAKEFKRRETVVAVSWAVYRHIRHFAGVESQVILNGVDTAIYYPGKSQRNTVLHVSQNPAKGSRIVEALSSSYHLEYLNAGAGEEPKRFRQGKAFLFPSRSEGNSYALLEAMATGLSCVSSLVGLAEDLPETVCWVARKYDVEEFRRGLNHVVNHPLDPRPWVERYASWDVWHKQWEKIIKSFKQGV